MVGKHTSCGFEILGKSLRFSRTWSPLLKNYKEAIKNSRILGSVIKYLDHMRVTMQWLDSANCGKNEER